MKMIFSQGKTSEIQMSKECGTISKRLDVNTSGSGVQYFIQETLCYRGENQ